MLNPFLPQFIIQMDIPYGLIGLILALNAAIAFFSNIWWGALSDRIGRKPVMLICRYGTLAGYIVLAFSTNLPLLIISRVLDGVFARTVSIGLTIVGDEVEPKRRGIEMSNVGAAWIAGGLAGPAVGAFLAARGIFGLGAAVALLALITIIITHWGVEESHPNIVEGGSVSQKHSAAPVFSPRLFKNAMARRLLLQGLISKVPYFMFVTTTSIYVTARFNLAIPQIGALFTAISAVNLVIRLIFFPPLLRSAGDRKTIRVGFFLYLVGFIWLIFARSVWEFFIISLFISFATSCALDVMSGRMSNAVAPHEMGEILGLNSASESFALIIGPIMGSALIGAPGAGAYGGVAAAFALFPLMLEFLPLREVSNAD